MFKFLLGIVVVVICLLSWVLTRPAAPRPFADAYHEALQTHAGDQDAIDSGLAAFERTYADLTHPQLGERIRSLYAQRLYFNDSLKTFHDRDDLVAYMEATGSMLERSEVDVERVLRDGADVFIRWTMRFTASALGDPVTSESVGMSHLRFDLQGRIVLHQDFWDSAAGLYRNLPMVGYALEKVDKRMVAD
ncbi:MAG: nuclear transport factor 2 family protein [Candidatus Wenzhouxiangella sp. M2_3B_020]